MFIDKSYETINFDYVVSYKKANYHTKCNPCQAILIYLVGEPAPRMWSYKTEKERDSEYEQLRTALKATLILHSL